MTRFKYIIGLFALIGLIFSGCEESGDIFKPFNPQKKRPLQDTHPIVTEGVVYTMTNANVENEVLVFRRNYTGELDFAGNYSTKGQSIGGKIDPLASQGSIVLSTGFRTQNLTDRWLFAVNNGSKSISVFAVTSNGLELRDDISSGGGVPVSVTYHDGLLYVLNRSDTDSDPLNSTGNINGFQLDESGHLEEIPGSVRPLSSSVQTEAAQIRFSPDGGLLVVTEKATGLIDVYVVDKNGLLDGPITHPATGSAPFGFDFDYKGQLIVAELVDGTPSQMAGAQGSVSLYELGSDGHLQVVSPSVPTEQTGSSRAVVTRNGQFSYVANSHSGTISGFQIAENGRLKGITQKTVVADLGTGSFPTDMALSADDRFLYVLDPGIGTIHSFQIQSDGKLKLLNGVEAPIELSAYPSLQGLAAY